MPLSAPPAAQPTVAAHDGRGAMDIDDIIGIIDQQQPGAAGKAGAKSAAHRRPEAADCLSHDAQGTHHVPQFSSRPPQPPRRKGWTMPGKDCAKNRYLGRAFMTRCDQSPGPIYQPRAFPERSSSVPRQTFGREGLAREGQPRQMGWTGRDTPGPGPAGPDKMHWSPADGHDGHPGPGSQRGTVTRPRSAMCLFAPPLGRQASSRFGAAKEYISAAHSQSAGPSTAEDFPGPQAYFPDQSRQPRTGPAWSFGADEAARPGRQRFNSKVFISRQHNASAGPRPGPAPGEHHSQEFERAASSRGKRAPEWSMGPPTATQRPQSADAAGQARRARRHCSAQFISAEHAAREPPRDDYPGPGTYFAEEAAGEERDPAAAPADGRPPRPASALTRGPAYSFGVQTNAAGLFISKEHTADVKGKISPGPAVYFGDGVYDPAAARHTAPSWSFADPDPEVGGWKDRFAQNQYIGSGIGVGMGGASPGPAEYDVADVELPRGPAHSMARRERLLMKRICPAPERARFFSKELAKENYGCYSPGPKYAIASALGQLGASRGGAIGTFGVSDRTWGDAIPHESRHLLGSTAKPYTTPGEARYISQEHAIAYQGRYGPGPAQYTPQVDAERQFEARGDGAPKRFRVAVSSRHRTAPAVSIGRRAPHRVVVDRRDASPSAALTQRSAPSFGFGTATRLSGGAAHAAPPAGAGAGAGGGKGGDGEGAKKEDKRHIEATPGPGQFTPNYAAVERHVPGVGLGGLAAGCGQAVAKPKPAAGAGGSPDKGKKVRTRLKAEYGGGMVWAAAGTAPQAGRGGGDGDGRPEAK